VLDNLRRHNFSQGEKMDQSFSKILIGLELSGMFRGLVNIVSSGLVLKTWEGHRREVSVIAASEQKKFVYSASYNFFFHFPPFSCF
jgi:hypothetical protein